MESAKDFINVYTGCKTIQHDYQVKHEVSMAMLKERAEKLQASVDAMMLVCQAIPDEAIKTEALGMIPAMPAPTELEDHAVLKDFKTKMDQLGDFLQEQGMRALGESVV